MWPTPPEAAVTRMFLRGPLPSRLSPADWVRALRAERPATGKVAPSAADTSGGRLTVRSVLATAYSARPPPVCFVEIYDHKSKEKSIK